MSEYIQHVLDNIADDGMTPELWNLVNDDIKYVDDFNIANNREQNLLFYVRYFMDDLLHDYNVDIKNKESIVKKVFDLLRNKDDIDLKDIRSAVLRSITTKNAYPNTMGLYHNPYGEKENIDRWVEVMDQISRSQHKDKTFERLTKDWNGTEKTNFKQWLKYYKDNNHMKYAFDKQAVGIGLNSLMDSNLSKLDSTMEDEPAPQQEGKNLTDYKLALISRLRSAERLLEKLSNELTDQKWDYLYRTLTALRGEITRLKFASSINDCIIRTANIWDHKGFEAGAQELRKIAAPGGDLAQKIENALSGGTEGGSADEASGFGDVGGGLGEEPDMLEGLTEDEPSEETKSESTSEMDAPDSLDVEEPGDDAGKDELLSPPKEEEDVLEVEEPELDKEESFEIDEPSEANPFSNSTNDDIVNLLDPFLQKCRNRDNVRILSKADMMLEAQNLAAYFPEISEAIAKQIECDNYIANRLEKIVGKLKGGKGSVPEAPEAPTAAPSPPSVEMDELTQDTLEVEEPTESPQEKATGQKEPSAGETTPVTTEAPTASPTLEAPVETPTTEEALPEG